MVPRLPLPAAALFFAAGLLLPLESPPPLFLLGTLSLLALTAGLLAVGPGAGCGGARSGFRRTLGFLLIPAAFLPLGRFVAAAESPLLPADDVRRLLQDRGGAILDPADLEGSLRADPYRHPPPGGGCSLEIDLRHLSTTGFTGRTAGVVRVRIPDAPDGVTDPCASREGTRLRLAATLALPRSFGNPGALDYPAYLASRGVAATGRSPSARLHQVLGPPPPLERAAGAVRRGIVASFRRAFEPPGSSGARAIEEAIVLGTRDRVPREAARILREAGTSHLLAISGFHVAVLSLCVWRASRLAPLRRTGRLAILLMTLGSYLILTARAPSVLRAVACAALHVSGRLLGRQAIPFNTVAAIFVALTALHPSILRGHSFQLSFLAAAALAAFLPLAASFLRRGRALPAAVAVNGVALLSTSPLTIFLFNRATPGAFLANVAAAPLMGIAFSVGLAIPAADAITRLLEYLGVPFRSSLSPVEIAGTLARACIEGTLAVSRTIAALPAMNYYCVTPEAWTIAAALLACGVAAMEGLPRRLRAGAGLLFCVFLIRIALPLESQPTPPRAADTAGTPPVLSATVLDVGQGSATLIETPGGKRLLVDAGGFPGTTFDVGERVVARALHTMGIRRLDAVAASHADVDHIGGLRSVMEIFGGGEIWLPGGSLAEPPLERLAAQGVASGRVLRLLVRGKIFRFGGATVRVLHPSGTPTRAPDNDRSLVLLIEVDGGRVLLPGDIEARSEVAIAPMLSPAEILVVPHHGSRTSSSLRFLETLRPSLSIISCGLRNRYAHPHEEAVLRLLRAGTRILRTDRDGAVRVEIQAGTNGFSPGIRAHRHGAGRWIPLRSPGPPASGSRPQGIGDEAGRQDQDRQRGQGEPRRGQPAALVDQPRVARAEEDEERSPEKPRLVDDEAEGHEDAQGEPRCPPMEPLRHGVRDVASVKLPDRKEVQRRCEETDPAGHGHPAEREDVSVRRGRRLRHEGH